MSMGLYKNLLLAIPLLALTACGMPPFDPSSVKKKFPKDNFPVSDYVSYKDREMHFVEYGDKDGSLIVFVHGSPGSWEAYGHFLADPNLSSIAHMIAVDRPGFGESEKGKWEESLEVQAGLIAKLIKNKATDKKVLVVGHSFGGPIMARLAMDYPNLVDNMIILAGSVDPELEKIRWFNHLADTWLASAVLPSMWRVSNKEILPLRQELLDIEGRWGEIKTDIIVVQGTKDTLVPPGNATYIKQKALNSSVELIILEGENHFLPWNQEELIKRLILSRL